MQYAQTAYSCCDALFIISLAALLLDWHSSLFIDQPLPFEYRHVQSTFRETHTHKKHPQTQAIRVVKLIELTLGCNPCSLNCLSPTRLCSPAFVVQLLYDIFHALCCIISIHTLFYLFI